MKVDRCIATLHERRAYGESRAHAENAAQLSLQKDAMLRQLQLAVRMKEFDIASELDLDVQQIQEALRGHELRHDHAASEAAAELLSLKDQSELYTADLRHQLISLRDGIDRVASLCVDLRELSGEKMASQEEGVLMDGLIHAASTATAAAEAAASTAHGLQELLHGNPADAVVAEPGDEDGSTQGSSSLRRTPSIDSEDLGATRVVR